MSINKVIITGNLTRDPELRATPTGTSVLSFSVAVNDRRKNASSGEWEDVPNYIDCNLFGTRAEALSKYLFKGSKVGVDGKLRWSQWEKDGQKRSKVDVTVDNIELLSPRNSGVQTTYQNDSGAQASYQNDSGSQASYQNDSGAQNSYQADSGVQNSYQDAVAMTPVPTADTIPAAPEITVYDEDIPF